MSEADEDYMCYSYLVCYSSYSKGACILQCLIAIVAISLQFILPAVLEQMLSFLQSMSAINHSTVIIVDILLPDNEVLSRKHFSC